MRRFQESSLQRWGRAQAVWLGQMLIWIHLVMQIKMEPTKTKIAILTIVLPASGCITPQRNSGRFDPGVLENTTVGVTIDTEDLSVADEDLIRLVANSAGIDRQEANQKITVIRTLAAGSRPAGKVFR